MRRGARADWSESESEATVWILREICPLCVIFLINLQQMTDLVILYYSVEEQKRQQTACLVTKSAHLAVPASYTFKKKTTVQ